MFLILIVYFFYPSLTFVIGIQEQNSSIEIVVHT